MKQSMLVAAASAAIGAAVAILLTHDPAPASRRDAPSRSLDSAALEVAFVRALERAGFGRLARSQPQLGTDPSGGAAVPATRRLPESAEEGGAPVARENAGEVLPPANIALLSGVASFSDDERLRRTWILRSEREVIEWLGTPDEIWVGEHGETWIYNLAENDQVNATFARGRLVDLQR